MFTNTGEWRYFGPTEENRMEAEAEYPRRPSPDFPGGCEVRWFEDGKEGAGWYARHREYRS